MRSFIIISVLSALAACYGAAVFPTLEELSQNLGEPYTVVDYADDYAPSGRNEPEEMELFFEKDIFVIAAPAAQRLEISFHGEPDMKIRRISRTMYFIPPNSTTWFLNNEFRVTLTVGFGDFMLGVIRVYGDRIVPGIV